MNATLAALVFVVISAVLAIWIWSVVDLLNRDLSRKEMTKWLVIILIFPIVGFILYFRTGQKNKIL